MPLLKFIVDIWYGNWPLKGAKRLHCLFDSNGKLKEIKDMPKPLIAHRMENISFSGIRKVFDKASRLEAEGRRVIHFESGKPDPTEW